MLAAVTYGGFLLIGAGAAPRLPAALGSLLLLLQSVASVALAAVLVGEAPSALQLAGVAVLVAGVLVASVERPSAAGPAG